MAGTIVIAHLYPGDMNIYGDVGNVIALRKRLEWRGWKVEVRPVEIGRPVAWEQIDLVFGGGGQDSGQLLTGPDLLRHGEELREMVVAGVPMLAICGTYQLFGRGFTTVDGREIPGIDIFKASTIGSSVRMIGNVVLDTAFGQVVGFENHSGQTLLEPGQAALGVVRKGYGNSVRSQKEGAVSHNAIGTYLHGPLLPKNPALADHLLLGALRRRYNTQSLEPLPSAIEHAAAVVAKRRPQ
jgi:lipid II isoglutaminyl synthase (glutamine-hydrolysing)